MTNSDSIYHRTQFTNDGTQHTRVALTDQGDLTKKCILAYGHHIIPIIFIPGVMGSNLREKNTCLRYKAQAVWRPPNTDFRGILETLWALITYWNKTPADRQRELNWENVEVDPDGPIDRGPSNLPESLLRARGWGSVLRQSYHPIMSLLQQQLNHIMELGQLLPYWQKLGEACPADYGDSKNNAPLTLAELTHAARYRFDIWAAGYNWLQNNEYSAQDIIHYINHSVLAWYTTQRLVANKVILVTHSMGGLVSRAITELHHFDKVLGVIHGAEPATGAPATYKRMRAGFEGLSSIILGTNAAEVTAILATSPGPLQLLPMPDYDDGQAWLMLRDIKTKQILMRLPSSAGLAYDEIYSSQAWYGLIPAGHETLINPAKIEFNHLRQKPSVPASSAHTADLLLTPRAQFNHFLKDVQAFHEKIMGRFHPETYIYFGMEERVTAQYRVSSKSELTHEVKLADRRSWGSIIWEGTGLDNMVNWQQAALTAQAKNGTVNGYGKTLHIGPPRTAGDGTVPFVSGSAASRFAKAVFCHGCHQKGRFNQERPGFDGEGYPGYDHQDSYNDPRAQFATLYSVIKLANLVQEAYPT